MSHHDLMIVGVVFGIVGVVLGIWRAHRLYLLRQTGNVLAVEWLEPVALIGLGVLLIWLRGN